MASDKTIGRIAAQIKRRAAHCLQHEIADPRGSFVTVTNVELSTDLTHAKILYSVLGDVADISKTQHMLDHAAGFIQRRVGSILRMRRIPRMVWVYDDSIARADELQKLINDSIRRDGEIRGETEELVSPPEPGEIPTEPKDLPDGSPDASGEGASNANDG